MKTQNNNQRTASPVSKMVLYSAVIFSVATISLTASAQNFWKQYSNAGNYGKMASVIDQTSETEIADAVDETIHPKISTQCNNSLESKQVEPGMTDESNFTSLPKFSKIEETLEYNPQNFVENEMATEKENLMNSEAVIIEESLEYNPQKFVEIEMEAEKSSLMNENTETIEAELKFQAEALIPESEYMAAKFVNEEMMLENVNRMNKEDFIEAAEAYTADGSEQEVAKYAQKVINQNPIMIASN